MEYKVCLFIVVVLQEEFECKNFRIMNDKRGALLCSLALEGRPSSTSTARLYNAIQGEIWMVNNTNVRISNWMATTEDRPSASSKEITNAVLLKPSPFIVTQLC